MLRAERPRSRGSVRRSASVTCRTLGQVTAPATPDAVRAVCGAWQVTLADTAWGREHAMLWLALAEFARQAVRS